MDQLPVDHLRATLPARRDRLGWRPARQRRLRAHGHRLPRGPRARVQGDLQRDPLRDRRLRHRPERRAVGDLQHQVRRQHPLYAHRQRTVGGSAGDRSGLRPAWQPAPLPDRVGHERRQVLRGRQPGRDPHRDLPAEPARDRQRVQLRRARADRRLDADEPIPRLRCLHLTRLRRGSGSRLGCAHLELRRTVRHRGRAQRPHRQHPDARRHLELLHPDRLER